MRGEATRTAIARRGMRGGIGRAALRTLLIALAILGVTGAWAHQDLPIVDATLELAPGESQAFPTSIHYHRIVGRYTADGAASDVSIVLMSTPPGEGTAPADSEPAGDFDVLLADGLAPVGTVNRLVRCCDARVWTDARLIVRNDGVEPATVDLRAWAMHDDFAVVVDRAETGAMGTPLALFLGLGIAAGVVAWNDRRRSGAATGTGPLPPSFRWSAGLFLGSLAIALALAVGGMLRYGAGPVDGMVAILADVPVPGGPFGARDAMVMSVLMLAWMVAIGLWIRALHLGAHRRSPWPIRLGWALGLVSLVGGVAMGWTYGRPAVPVVLGLVLAIPLVVVSLGLGGPSARRPASAEAPS